MLPLFHMVYAVGCSLSGINVVSAGFIPRGPVPASHESSVTRDDWGRLFESSCIISVETTLPDLSI